MIHQCVRELYPDMPLNTTRSLLKRLSKPNKDGHTLITKVGYGEYCSNKRAAILAQMQVDADAEKEEGKEEDTKEDMSRKSAISATVAIIGGTSTKDKDTNTLDTKV